MLTPQEVAEHTFARTRFTGGYNITMVDEFLDELTDDYTALYKENTALKAKMKVLVDKVEEYRATEDAMRKALLTAQNMASSMVSEAEEKKETLLADAEMEARARIGALHDEIVTEQKRLNILKERTKSFVEQTRALCEGQLKQLERLPDLTPEKVEQTTKEAKVQRETAVDVAALGEKIVASYERELPADSAATAVFTPTKQELAADPSDATVMFPTAKPNAAARHSKKNGKARGARFADGTAHGIELADLTFGRNSSGGDE